jgi:hypothetical protein
MMSDISISFPLWLIAWFLLSEATPFISLRRPPVLHSVACDVICTELGHHVISS